MLMPKPCSGDFKFKREFNGHRGKNKKLLKINPEPTFLLTRKQSYCLLGLKTGRELQ